MHACGSEVLNACVVRELACIMMSEVLNACVVRELACISAFYFFEHLKIKVHSKLIHGGGEF
jgi:hypothetical protein